VRARFPVTVHLLFFRENQILMLRRFNTGYRDGEYSVPAGHLDGNEIVMAAAAREAKEEIGVEFEAGAVAFSSVMHRTEDDERVDFFLHIAKWQGEPVNAEPDKCDEVCWVEVNNLPLNTIPYVRQAIQNHLNRVRFDEFGW
jgi:ADP-ribose pyrophosphatase YjhB (NUDIX family)